MKVNRLFRHLAAAAAALLCMLMLAGACAEEANPLSDFIYVAREDHAEILGYVGTDISVVVPDYIGGQPVTIVRLGNSYYDSQANAFEFVRSVTLPQTIVRLDAFGLGGYGLLEEVKGLEYVQELGDSVFAGCGLTEAHFSTALRDVSWSAFNASQQLKKLTLPDDVSCFDASFSLSGVEELTLLRGDGEATIKVVDDVLFSADGKRLLCVLPSLRKSYYAIPEGTEFLISSALGYNIFVEEYEYPESLTEIMQNMVFQPGQTMTVPEGSYAHSFFEAYNGTEGLDDVNLRVLGADGTQSVQALVDGIVADAVTDGMSELQKARALHDWICDNGSYDYGMTNAQAIHILSGGAGTCDAYARAYCILLDAVGVEARWVPCMLEGVPHAINAVKLDGGWYLVDCTNDDGGFGRPDELFCFNSDVFWQFYTVNGDLVSLYHSDEMVQRAVSLKYYAPYRAGRMSAAETALNALIQSALDSGETIFRVSLPEGAGLSSIPAQALCSLMQRAEWTVNGRICTLDCATADGLTYECYLDSPGNQIDYTYETGENGVILTQYKGSAEEVEVPAEVDGLPVIGLQGTFEDNRTVRSVVLPEGLVSIGARTFRNCYSLESVNFPGTLKTIGDFAFDGCLSLSVPVRLPDGLTGLGFFAFRSCASITAVSLPGTLTNMGDEVFSSCPSLSAVTLKEGVSRIPSGTFFGCTSLKHLSLPQSLTAIGSTAFTRSSIVSLVLPANVQQVDWSAFVWAERLTELKVSEGNPWLWARDGMLVRSSDNFLIAVTCATGADVVIPEGVEAIASYAFSINETVRSVTIPGSVRVIHAGAFAAAAELETVYIADGVEIIGDYAFAADSVSAVRSNHESGTIICGISTTASCITSIRLPETLISLGQGALAGNEHLKQLILPASLGRLEHSVIDRPQVIYVPEAISYIAPQEMIREGETVIHGVGGSYAESFAAEYGYTFVDVNKKLTLNRELMYMVLRQQAALTVAAADGQQTEIPAGEVQWSVSGGSVTVENGRLTAVTLGTSEITAVWNGYTGSCTVEVIDVTRQLSDVAYMGSTMRVGDCRYIKVVDEGVDMNEFVTWTVSPAGILTVQATERGYLIVQAVGPGACTLTATLPSDDTASTDFEVLGTAFDEDADWTPSGENDLVYDVTNCAQIGLTELLAGYGLSGSITDAEVSDQKLLGASNASGEWVLTVFDAFEEPQWLQFRLDGLIYRLNVTNSRSIHCLSLDTAGGSGVASWYVPDGAAAGIPSPRREGFAFLDWYIGSSRFDPAVPVREDAALTACWVQAVRLEADAVLPDDLSAIGEDAFAGMAARAVHVPDGCVSIGAGAFRGCASLCQIRIPAGCTVADGAFDGCGQLIIFGTPGSAAEEYAAAHENCAFAWE